MLLSAVLLGACALTACTGQSTSTAQCAYVVGDGQDGRDRMIRSVTYPNQETEALDTKVAQFIPCGPRNFIINDGSVKDANGKQVGDRFTPTKAWTKETPGKPRKQVDIWTSSFWTLNQDGNVLREFYTLCYKYTCYTEDAEAAGDANYSTPGWNGMLGENFGGAIDQAAVQVVAANFDSDIVKDPTKWAELGNLMAEEFKKQARARTGYAGDLFCGSGNSGWKDPANPGAKDNPYTCTNVRVTIDLVQSTDPKDREADTAASAVAQRVANAKQLYGSEWAHQLGVQDAIDKCRNNKETTCVINIGGESGNVPANSGQ
jgi:hypothetical protein